MQVKKPEKKTIFVRPIISFNSIADNVTYEEEHFLRGQMQSRVGVLATPRKTAFPDHSLSANIAY